jgi:hypothetical protein
MTIVYVNVCRARDAAVLCEATNVELRSTNVAQVTTQLLEHLRDHPGLVKDGDCRTFIQKNQEEKDFFSNFVEACQSAMGESASTEEDHFFHLYLKDEVYYVCLGDDPDTRDQKVNFHLLHQIQAEFTKLYGFRRINTAHAYSLDNTFAPVLRSAIHYHNVNHRELASDVKVQKIQSKVDNLQSILGRNISLVLDNQQRMEKLLATSEVMREDALVFRRKSQRVLQSTKKKNWCLTIVAVVAVTIGIYLAVLGACGKGLRYCRAAATNSDQSGYNGGDPYDSSSSSSNNNNYNNGDADENGGEDVNEGGDNQQAEDAEGGERFLLGLSSGHNFLRVPHIQHN